MQTGAPEGAEHLSQRKGTSLRMLRRAFLPTFYDLYQMIIAVIGMIGVNRILFGFSWRVSVEYALVTVAAYWVGQGFVALLQKSPKTSLD
jgi:hypothetical protein